MIPTFVRARILNDSYTNNIVNLSKDYSDIVWALQRINYSLYEFKVPVKSWQEQLEVLVVKFGEINFSLIHLIRGTPMPHYRTRNVTLAKQDMGSIYILLRAIIETYLTIYYLNFQVTGDDHGQFRNQLYKYSGLGRRQSFHVQGKEGNAKLAAEKKTMEEIEKQILSNKYFQNLDARRQGELLGKKYDAREMSWTTLIMSRGIKSTRFLTLWKLFSNHAHAEYIGTIQYKEQLLNPNDVAGIYSFASQPVMLCALLIDDFLKAFGEPLKLIYDSFEEDLRTKIDVYRDLIMSEELPIQ
jgi:hypothetical protein